MTYVTAERFAIGLYLLQYLASDSPNGSCHRTPTISCIGRLLLMLHMLGDHFRFALCSGIRQQLSV